MFTSHWPETATFSDSTILPFRHYVTIYCWHFSLVWIPPQRLLSAFYFHPAKIKMNRIFFTEFRGSSEYSCHTFSAGTVECCTQQSAATEARICHCNTTCWAMTSTEGKVRFRPQRLDKVDYWLKDWSWYCNDCGPWCQCFWSQTNETATSRSQ